ncbi:RNAPII degradation factor [Basidiobolus ranarum]|uniref:RNAPII degradation factor n=1 Tax=Basidiobolus ranarum TaxID=34480 RepID=A0ABR2VZC4_9FUNG
MGPMGDYGTTLYGNDAQRALMGYYADPAYGQIPSNYQRDSRLPMQDSATIPSSTQSGQNASLTSQASPQPQSQQLQQPSYPELAGIPYYPYYYVPNQFHTPAYQQSGYGQPFMNKNIYPYYGSQQTSKPGTSATGSPYTSAAYPSNTLNQPNSYSQGPPGVGRYDDISLSGSNNGGIGSGVSEYQKGYKSDLPLQGFLGSSTGQQQGSAESSKNASGQNTHDMNSPYKNYADPSNVYNQSAQGGQYGGYQQQMYGGYQQQYAQQSQQQYQQYQMQQQNHQQQQSGGYHHQQGRSQGYWS